MVKIGLLLASYNDSDFLSECLSPWFELRKNFDIKIAICHGLFKEQKELGIPDNDVKSIKLLKEYKDKGLIDFLYIDKEDNNLGASYNEAELRNIGLKFLLNQDIEWFWTIGSDEYYTKEQIMNIIQYIQADPFIFYYRIHHKNYTFSKNTYIDGFCPPRIWRNQGRFKIKEFYWDDDILYIDKQNNTESSYQEKASQIVPKHIACIKHYTWLSDERGKQKVEYQEKHFKGGNGCSFKWDEKNNCLIWNEEYFKKSQMLIPQLFSDGI